MTKEPLLDELTVSRSSNAPQVHVAARHALARRLIRGVVRIHKHCQLLLGFVRTSACQCSGVSPRISLAIAPNVGFPMPNITMAISD